MPGALDYYLEEKKEQRKLRETRLIAAAIICAQQGGIDYSEIAVAMVARIEKRIEKLEEDKAVEAKEDHIKRARGY